ncbi:MAG TPA: hypothetical protein VHA70_12755 [Bauldia sp.]|nr:hypothetical protein [Bauldia sp.]
MTAEPVEIERLTEDAAGESHFDSFTVERPLMEFAPPALPFFASSVQPARGFVHVRIPKGWVGAAHPAPQRQICFCLGGALKVTASDGTVRTIGPGDAWQMMDVTGKGHAAEVVSDVPFDAVMVLLPESS